MAKLLREKGRNSLLYITYSSVFTMAEPIGQQQSKDDISPVAAVTGIDSPTFHAVGSPSISSAEKDDNYAVYQQYRDSEFTDEEIKRVLRKIDIQLLPLLITIYTLQYLDKNSINFAEVYGFEKGTGLHGQDYSWLSK